MSQGAEAHLYQAFGVTFASDIELPELASGAAPADVRILRSNEPDPLAGSPYGVRMRFREQGAAGPDTDEMSWRDVGSFTIRGADEISVIGAPGAEGAYLTLPLLGPVMAVLLHRRGLLVLHGSAVLHRGKVSIFLGDKGAGKSTTAAALIKDGGLLLTDDLVALEMGDNVRLWPGFAQVKLTDTAAAAMVMPTAMDAPSPHPDFTKHIRRLPGGLEADPVAVDAIYILERGEDFARTPLPGTDGLTAIMRFSYLIRFGDTIIQGAGASEHFKQCARAAKDIPVVRLTTPNDLERLKGVGDYLGGGESG